MNFHGFQPGVLRTKIEKPDKEGSEHDEKSPRHIHGFYHDPCRRFITEYPYSPVLSLYIAAASPYRTSTWGMIPGPMAVPGMC
jgi:hypothetical protein